MTVPPPPPGNNPPYGDGFGLAQQGSGGYAPAVASLPADAYTPWLTRVFAFLIDSIAPGLISAIGAVFFFAEASKQVSACVSDTSEFELGEFCATGNQGATAAGTAALLVCVALSVVFQLWNIGYRQGTTGSTIGKSIMKFKVVSEKTWQPIGFGMSIVRQLVHAVDGAVCYIGYLFPLWDKKRQTIADKIMATVCTPL